MVNFGPFDTVPICVEERSFINITDGHSDEDYGRRKQGSRRETGRKAEYGAERPCSFAAAESASIGHTDA